MMALIRSETPADYATVFDVNLLAFGRPDEANLVDAVRPRAGHSPGLSVDPLISLVAELDGRVIGHILLSPVTVTVVEVTGKSRKWPAMGLGPLAVIPDYQRQGIGSQLILAGLDGCRQIGQDIVFVLGHPDYYPRFGFEPATAKGLHYHQDELAPYFFVIELAPAALAGRTGRVRYLPAFEEI